MFIKIYLKLLVLPYPTDVSISDKFEDMPEYLKEWYMRVNNLLHMYLIIKFCFKAYRYFAKMVLAPLFFAQVLLCYACYKIGKMLYTMIGFIKTAKSRNYIQMSKQFPPNCQE